MWSWPRRGTVEPRPADSHGSIYTPGSQDIAFVMSFLEPGWELSSGSTALLGL